MEKNKELAIKIIEELLFWWPVIAFVYLAITLFASSN